MQLPGPAYLRRIRNPTTIFVLDQVVSSLTNVIVVLAAARAGNRYEFGAFSIVFGICVLSLGLRATTLGDLVLVRRSDDDDFARSAAGSSVYLGLLTGGIAAVTAVVINLPSAIAITAVAFPMLLLQDSMRYWAFAKREPARALFLDVTWLLVQSLALVIAGQSVGAAFASWMLGGTAASLLGLRYLAPNLHPVRLARFLRSQGALLRPYAFQYALTTGTTQVFTFLVAGLGSVRDAGALRGAQTIMGPYNIYLSADRVDLVTRLRARDQRRRIVERFVLSAVVVTLLAAGLVTVTLLIPDRIGEQFLGASWRAASAALPLVAVQFWLIGLAQCFQARLVAAMRPNAALRVKFLSSVASVAALGITYSMGVDVLQAALLALVAGSILNLGLTGQAARRVAPISHFVTPTPEPST